MPYQIESNQEREQAARNLPEKERKEMPNIEIMSKRNLKRMIGILNEKEQLTPEEVELRTRIERRLYEIDRQENPPPTTKFLPEKEWEW